MPKPVILFQDGAIDELMSVALLTTMPRTEINYLGCFIVNGDCLAWPTVQAQVKLLRYMRELDATLPKTGKDRQQYLNDKFGGPDRAASRSGRER